MASKLALDSDEFAVLGVCGYIPESIRLYSGAS
jgi:hypothetical protein